MWEGGNAAGRTNAHSAQMVLDSVNSFSEAVSSYSGPWAKALSGMLADKVAPSYWRPNQEIIVSVCSKSLERILNELSVLLQMCHACKRNFEKTGLSKHHCRGCGEGFCHPCSQHKVPVPARSWLQPVRVCNDCHQQLQREPNAIPGKEGAQYGQHSCSVSV